MLFSCLYAVSMSLRCNSKIAMTIYSFLRETIVFSFILLVIFLFPFPMVFQICGLSFQTNFCLYIVFVVSEFVGREAFGFSLCSQWCPGCFP